MRNSVDDEERTPDHNTDRKDTEDDVEPVRIEHVRRHDTNGFDRGGGRCLDGVNLCLVNGLSVYARTDEKTGYCRSDSCGIQSDFLFHCIKNINHLPFYLTFNIDLSKQMTTPAKELKRIDAV